MLSIFKPAPHRARLPEAEIDPLYRRLRWQIFLGIFFGYAAYYLVRKNFALAMPYLVEQGLFAWRSRVRAVGDLHRLRLFEIHHGIGVGSLESARVPASRSDPGGGGDAVYGLCAMGNVQHRHYVCAVVPVRLVPGDGMAAMRAYHGALVVAKERGGIVSVWNCAHNVGGGIPPLLFLLGMAWFNDWHAALYMPAFGAILVAIIAFALMRDTPQSCGLPPIEEYKTTIRMITARSTKKS